MVAESDVLAWLQESNCFRRALTDRRRPIFEAPGSRIPTNMAATQKRLGKSSTLGPCSTLQSFGDGIYGSPTFLERIQIVAATVNQQRHQYHGQKCLTGQYQRW